MSSGGARREVGWNYGGLEARPFPSEKRVPVWPSALAEEGHGHMQPTGARPHWGVCVGIGGGINLLIPWSQRAQLMQSGVTALPLSQTSRKQKSGRTGTIMAKIYQIK